MHDILLYALPLFVACMALEWAWGRWRGRDTYGLGDTLSSLSQGLLSQATALVTPLFQTGLYAVARAHLAVLPGTLWQGLLGSLAAVVMYDFCDYWLHRVSHESALFWAAHAVHHQSEHFNLSTALRQESLYPVMGWPFFLPMAVLGVPVEQFALAGIVVLFYQFWIHTEHIGRLGWLDGVLSTPSNHRVHHAVNPLYLDRNYGAIFVIWDRLFGSFQPETEACIYGTVKPLASWNPLQALGQFYLEMGRRMRATPRAVDKLRVLVKSPGWMPPGAAGAAETSAERLARPRFDPPTTGAARALAVSLFLALAAATVAWLWADDALSAPREAALATLLVLGLCSVSGALRGRHLPAWALTGWGAAAAMLALSLSA